jgi:hypothetical protein
VVDPLFAEWIGGLRVSGDAEDPRLVEARG